MTSSAIAHGRYTRNGYESGLRVPAHDYVSNTYTGNNATSSVYKLGGASGITVATVTRTFDGSNNLLTQTVVYP